ncbi:MAG: TM0106 family RecB-like putative nuclease [Candidatus Eisenbacteria bacterium]|nr:TM0106 family RecB-like putative nuclease [Candidatus Eisenbacteria bacterium]
MADNPSPEKKPKATPRTTRAPTPDTEPMPGSESKTESHPTIITAGHIYDYLLCPHKVYLDEFGDRSRMDPESDFERVLWDKGMAHEEEALERLGFAVAQIECEGFEECERETLRLMKGGEGFIYQGRLSAPSMRGSPDLLEKVRGKSRLGAYHYVPIDMKSGSAYEDEETGRFKEHYVLQLSFYADILEKVQGVKPETGKIVDGEFHVVSVDLKPFEREYFERLSEIRDLLSGKAESEPCIGGVCAQCHWRSFCYRWAKDRDDVSLVRKLNRPRRSALRENGIRTVSELAELGNAKRLPKFEGISGRALEQFVRRAVVFKRGEPILHSPVELPRRRFEIFFDIETEPLEEICYLYGIVEREGEEQRYLSFFADSPDEEESAWNAFWKYVSGLEDFQVYHYTSYEKTVLTSLSERYACDPALFERFFQESTDLYGLVDKCTEWPSHSYSIKAVSKLLGFEYSERDPGGLKAAMWYIEYAKAPGANRALREKIIQYNKEDCEAMIVLKDWLAKKNEEAFGR